MIAPKVKKTDNRGYLIFTLLALLYVLSGLATFMQLTGKKHGSTKLKSTIAKIDDDPVKFYLLDSNPLANNIQFHEKWNKMNGCVTKYGHKLFNAMERRPNRVESIEDASVVVLKLDGTGEINWPDFGHHGDNWLHHQNGYCQDFAFKPFWNDQWSASLEIARWLRDNHPDKYLLVFVNYFYGIPEIPEDLTNFIQASYELNPFSSNRKSANSLDISVPVPTHHDFSDAPIKGKRKYLATFQGSKRDSYAHPGTRIRERMAIGLTGSEEKGIVFSLNQRRHDYRDLMTDTDFSFVVSGDKPYSFRFLEVVSSGRIPIVVTDEWVLPFSEIIDWESIIIRIPEKSDWSVSLITDQTGQWTRERRDDAHEKIHNIWKKYFSTVGKRIDTLFDSVDQQIHQIE